MVHLPSQNCLKLSMRPLVLSAENSGTCRGAYHRNGASCAGYWMQGARELAGGALPSAPRSSVPTAVDSAPFRPPVGLRTGSPRTTMAACLTLELAWWGEEGRVRKMGAS